MTKWLPAVAMPEYEPRKNFVFAPGTPVDTMMHAQSATFFIWDSPAEDYGKLILNQLNHKSSNRSGFATKLATKVS